MVVCLLLSLGLLLKGSGAWAVDVGWMQEGVRVWYFGGVGSTTSSDAEEAYLFSAVNGSDVQVTKHSGMNHWGTTFAINTTTYSFLDKGPCWIHPQVLQNLQMGEYWMGFEIVTITRAPYTYDTFPYRLLPAKALFDLTPQRQVVKISYMLPDYSTGYAYFDVETGLCLFYSQMSGYVTVFFVLSEINYHFANQIAFSEDDGPHTGFKSFVSESSLGWNWPDPGGGTVTIHASVESRYGNTVEMWVITSECGETCYTPPYEYYCFFGGIPILRRTNMNPPPQDPPELWNEYGHYLWWWVPRQVLQNSTINVSGVPMNRTSTDPYIFEATGEPPGLFYFSKLWFGNDGYMTAFAAKDSTTGLDIAPGQFQFNNLTTVDGLDYYRETMGRSILHAGDVDGDFDVDLADAILSLRMLAGVPWFQNIGADADVNEDGRVGAEEAAYVMQKAAGLR